MTHTKKMILSALVAGLYSVLTLITAPISFGPIQLRIAEVLCLLPYYMPFTAVGLFLGCLIANAFTGNIIDIVFGSLSTLLSALICASLGKKEKSKKSELLSCLSNCTVNAIIVSFVICYGYTGVWTLNLYLSYALYLFISEAIVMFLIALPLMRYIKKLNAKAVK